MIELDEFIYFNTHQIVRALALGYEPTTLQASNWEPLPLVQALLARSSSVVQLGPFLFNYFQKQ